LRRVLGVIFSGVAIALIIWSNSKTAFGLALIVPVLAVSRRRSFCCRYRCAICCYPACRISM
jgi:hypothetical protein